jgi:hypothetical protein
MSPAPSLILLPPLECNPSCLACMLTELLNIIFKQSSSIAFCKEENRNALRTTNFKLRVTNHSVYNLRK